MAKGDMPPPPSSQETFYEENKIVMHHPDGQENIASSPLRPHGASSSIFSSQKIRKPPNITPKRFTKFFTPRNSLSSRRGRPSKAGRQLQDITRSGANWMRSNLTVAEDFLGSDAATDIASSRPVKRRKFSTDLASSPPQTSPLRYVQASSPVEVFEDDDDELLLSPTFSEAETIPDLFPKPIRRPGGAGSARRILGRSFGGYDALSRGRRGPDHVADPRSATSNFVTLAEDYHGFRGAALPFCTVSCNTNPLIAVGDEEGSVRLLDSSSPDQFSKSHVRFRVHRNAVMDVAFSSDDYILATASGDQTARVVDMQSQKVACILTGHKSSVKQVRFRPNDDNMVTTCARDGTVLLWDLRVGGRSAVQNFRASIAQGIEEDGKVEPESRYSQQELEVGCGHRSAHRPFETGFRNELSITSFQHLPNGREHLILTSSEVDASVKLWDLRNAGRRSPVPLSSTALPESHQFRRNYGINAMVLSGDGSRLYTVCRDNTIYAYSTNQLVLGYAPEMSSGPSRRRMLKEPKAGLGPLYGFRHPLLRIGTFYIKAALRPAKGDRGEMLAIGSTDKCAVLFPTDERHLPHRSDWSSGGCWPDERRIPPPSSQLSRRSTSDTTPCTQTLRTFEHGAALVNAHRKEVTSLAWTTEGNLISVSDDCSARCWREKASTAKDLRQNREAGALRWRAGWADVAGDWDEEEC